MSNPKIIKSAHLGTSAELFPNVLALYVPEGSTVADVTYGTGVFWRNVEPDSYSVLKSDRWEGAHNGEIRPYDFRDLLYADGSLDALVLDPPFRINDESHGCDFKKRDHYRVNMTVENHGPRSLGDLVKLYRDGAREAFRVLGAGGVFIVKVQDQVSGGRLRLISNDVIWELETLGFDLLDRFTLVSETTIPLKGGITQRHAKRNDSFFLVFRKRRRLDRTG